MLNIAVLVSGGGTNLEAIFKAMEDGRITDAKISVVISNNQQAYALERAKKRNVDAICVSPKSYETRQEFYVQLMEEIRSRKIDVIVLAGYLVQISSEMVDAFPMKILNIHPSLIPSFCGKGCYGIHVHENALERGVKITGATVHFVDGGTDTGPIILQKAVNVLPGDTPERLQKRVMEEAEWVILPEAIQLYVQGRLKVVDGQVIVEE
jgi:phosphoribosylglycinamide formyltransferase 1